MQSNLAFWRTRQNPRIRYTRLPDRDGRACLRDEVLHGRDPARPSVILGVDVLDAGTGRSFLWRGGPWYLRWMTSEWALLDHDASCGDWAVTYFTKTAFTAAGMDIYARRPTLPDATLRSILTRLDAHPFLRAQAATLFPTQHAAGSQGGAL